jgi:hypothetical protein
VCWLLLDDCRSASDAHFAAVRPAAEFRRYGEDDLRVIDMWVAVLRRD